MAESVYVLKNDNYLGLLKIGRTKDSVNKRAKQLSKDTGVPSPFIPLMKIKTNDCTNLEKLIHSHLKSHRNNPKKEFFKISAEELYTKLTEEMNLTVIRIEDDSYSSTDDDDDNACHLNICPHCDGKCGNLEKHVEKMYKQLRCVSTTLELFFKNMASDDAYDVVKHRSTIPEYDECKKYHEGLCEHKNNKYIQNRGFNLYKYHYLVNKLYDYEIRGCGQSSTDKYEYFVSKLRGLTNDVYQRERELYWCNSNIKEYLEKLKNLHDQKKEYMNKQNECQNEGELILCKDWVEKVEKRIKDLKEDQRIWKNDDKEWIKLVEKMSVDIKDLEKMFQERSQWCDLAY